MDTVFQNMIQTDLLPQDQLLPDESHITSLTHCNYHSYWPESLHISILPALLIIYTYYTVLTHHIYYIYLISTHDELEPDSYYATGLCI